MTISTGFGVTISPEKFRAEIEKATAIGKSFPPLHEAAAAIEIMCRDEGSVAGIPADDWRLLVDFLRGKHLRRRGESKDREENKDIDIDRTLAFWDYIGAGLSRTEALKKLMKSEKLSEVRSIERSITRGIEYLRQHAEDARIRQEAAEIERRSTQRMLDTLAPFAGDTGT